ncbi:MAG: hypothetical protein R2801_04640 [Chitinophagales bacterium]
MKSKEENIVENWLVRYTGTELNEFGQYILLTNLINTSINLQNSIK